MQPDDGRSDAELRAAMEADFASIAADIMESVPARLRLLIPTDLSPYQQLAWYRKAYASGLLTEPTVPPTDGGARPTIIPIDPDTSSLPLHARLAAGYSK